MYLLLFEMRDDSRIRIFGMLRMGECEVMRVLIRCRFLDFIGGGELGVVM